MALVSLDNAKEYLRVDTSDEDSLIASLLLASESLCQDVARLTDERWEMLRSIPDDSVHQEDGNGLEEVRRSAEDESACKVLRIAILYTLGYLYEHREEADHHGLTLTLRSLLFAVREGVV